MYAFIVSRIINTEFVEIVSTGFLYAPYKVSPSSITFLCVHRFFFVSFLSLTFSWACRSLPETWKFLYIHLFVKQLTHFLMNFSQTCAITSPMYAQSVILFSGRSKHLNAVI